MHDAHLFTDLLILFAVAFGAAMLMRLVRLPILIGFLLAGIVAGPSGLHLLEQKNIEALAELGVVLLLFTIGLEISVRQLWELRREALIGGSLQLTLTAIVATVSAWAFGLAVPSAIAVGLVVSLSSTAVVLRLLGERDQLTAPHGRIALAILLLQDIAVVPLTLLLPMLAGEGGVLDILLVLGEAILLAVLIIVLARILIPWLLDRIAGMRSREGYLLGVASIIFLITWLTSEAGLSPALGAFLAGLIISETEHKHLALAESAPFRDLLLAIFFVSVGLLIDLRTLILSPWIPLAVGLTAYIIKAGIITGIVRLIGYPLRIGFRSGLALGQIGEFSFVLLLLAGDLNVLSSEIVQTLLAAAALTLFITPFAINATNRPEKIEQTAGEPSLQDSDVMGEEKSGPILLIGFGPGGRITARTIKALGLPFHALELNPATVRRERERGIPIELGDASRPEVLEAAGVHKSPVVVITINDRLAVRPILIRVRQMAPKTYIIIRARFAAEEAELTQLGADLVIPEETEGALAIADGLLKHLGLPWDTRQRHLMELRAGGYRLQTGAVVPLLTQAGKVPSELATIVIEPGDPAVGLTLADLDLRRRTGATAIALVRGQEDLPNPADESLAEGDRLILSGDNDAIQSARELLTKTPDTQ